MGHLESSIESSKRHQRPEDKRLRVRHPKQRVRPWRGLNSSHKLASHLSLVGREVVRLSLVYEGEKLRWADVA